jgi:hypothetical protein
LLTVTLSLPNPCIITVLLTVTLSLPNPDPISQL